MNLCDFVRQGNDVSVEFFWSGKCKKCGKYYTKYDEEYSPYLTKENLDQYLKDYEDLSFYEYEIDDDDIDKDFCYDDCEKCPYRYNENDLETGCRGRESLSGKKFFVLLWEEDCSFLETLCPECDKEEEERFEELRKSGRIF